MNVMSSAADSTRAFEYRARDAAGTRSAGRITARDRQHATALLKAQGLFPIAVGPAQGTGASPGVAIAPVDVKSKPLNARAAARLISRLAKLTGQKVSIDQALGIVAEGGGRDGVPVAAAAILSQVREGAPLSTALTRMPGLSDPAIVALVQGAEASGEMAKALATADEILRTRMATLRSITTSLIYPAILFGIALFSMGLIMVAIIPQFRPLIEDRMDMVPFLGRMIFALSALASGLWPLIATLLLGGGFALWIAARRGMLGRIWYISQQLPGLRGIVRRNQVTMVLHVLGELLTRRITLSAALRVVVASAPDGPVRDAFEAARERVEGGDALSAALARESLVPPDVLEMIRIGEAAGDLPEMVVRAAIEARETTARDLERFLLLFQPALIVLVGLMIGVSLYALFSAIVSVNAISF